MSGLYDDDRTWSVMAAMVEVPAVIPAVVQALRPTDVGEGETRRTFDTIVGMFEAGVDLDLVRVADRLGDARLALRLRDHMAENGIVPSNAAWHAQRLHELAVLRSFAGVGSDLAGLTGSEAPGEVFEDATERLQLAAASLSKRDHDPASMRAASERVVEDSYQREQIVRTHMPSLDRALGGGLHPTRLYVVGARTGVGKTAFAGTIARRALDAGQRVLFVSLEMAEHEIFTRLVADRYDLDHEDLPNLLEAWGADDVQAWPLTVMTEATMATITARARQLVPRGLRLLVVDYIGLVPTSGRFERRDLEIGYITRTLKQLAGQLRIAVLALCQLNRVADGSPPRGAHLRESGNVEQDANVTLLLHRPFHDHADAAKRAETILMVDKNRHGWEGPIRLWFQANRTRFREAA